MNGSDIGERAYRSIGRLYGCAADDDFILEKGPLSLVYQRHRRLSASQSRRETRLVEGGGRRRKRRAELYVCAANVNVEVDCGGKVIVEGRARGSGYDPTNTRNMILTL